MPTNALVQNDYVTNGIFTESLSYLYAQVSS